MPKTDRVEIRLAGSGGQGIGLAVTVLAEAAVASGREVVATQSYGPEARGGASAAELIVAAGQIDFPEVTAPVLTLCLSQEAFAAYAAATAHGGLVVYDARLVEGRHIDGLQVLGVPLVDTAERRLGTPIAANMIALGAVQALTRVVTKKALAAAVRRRVPARLVDVDLRALRLGYELVRRPAGARGASSGGLPSAGTRSGSPAGCEPTRRGHDAGRRP